jgi:hypothetical protein
MKKQCLLILLMMIATVGFAQVKVCCYGGVYLDKADFLANRLSYKINECVKGDNIRFSFPADLTLTLKISKPDSVFTFKPGTIYGYYECGNIYRYSPGTEWNGQEDYYKIEEVKSLVIYSSVFISGAETFYSLNLTAPIHRLTMKNLETDFKDHPDFINAIKKLNKDVGDGLATRNTDGTFLINKIYGEIIVQ